MLDRHTNRWIEGLMAAPLALLLATACMAGPPEKEIRLETLILGADGNEDFLWVEADSAAFLGVQVEEETEHEEGGARVTRVIEDSPAEAAGIAQGDIIVSFGGDTVRGPVSLTTKIHAREPGDAVTVVVIRDGKKHKLEAELGDIAGCIVAEGVVRRSAPIRVLRDNVVIYEGELESLRRFKEDASEVRHGMECGIGVKNYTDVKVGDLIEVYEVKEIARTL